jgi:hypothetical protein
MRTMRQLLTLCDEAIMSQMGPQTDGLLAEDDIVKQTCELPLMLIVIAATPRRFAATPTRGVELG